MFIGAFGVPEFVSAIYLRHRRFTFKTVQRAAEVASGRPASTDAARWTQPGGLPGVMQRQEPAVQKQSIIDQNAAN